jgi:hypothetical protein
MSLSVIGWSQCGQPISPGCQLARRSVEKAPTATLVHVIVLLSRTQKRLRQNKYQCQSSYPISSEQEVPDSTLLSEAHYNRIKPNGARGRYDIWKERFESRRLAMISSKMSGVLLLASSLGDSSAGSLGGEA